MTCDRYKNALLNAAASEKLGTNLTRHLENCTGCCATLRTDRELFSRIDSALRARVNECPQVGFLAQVRVRLSKETAADAGSSPTLSVTCASLALVLIAMIYPIVNARRPRVPGNSQPPTTSALQSAGVTQTALAVSEESGVKSGQRLSRRSESRSVISQGPEVLVPPDEQRAFAQFVARVRGRDAMAEAVIHSSPVRTAAGTEIPEVHSVDIAGLQLEKERDEWMNESGGSE